MSLVEHCSFCACLCVLFAACLWLAKHGRSCNEMAAPWECEYGMGTAHLPLTCVDILMHLLFEKIFSSLEQHNTLARVRRSKKLILTLMNPLIKA